MILTVILTEIIRNSTLNTFFKFVYKINQSYLFISYYSNTNMHEMFKFYIFVTYFVSKPNSRFNR